MTIFTKIFGQPLVAMSNDEAVLAIKALERSAQAMPDMDETFKSRDSRETRERKLAAALRARIGGL